MQIVNKSKQRVIAFLLFVCFATSTSSLFAASDITTPVHDSPRLLHLDTSNGLSQNTVYDLLVDTHGYVYVGTEEGLDRYDGHDVIRMKGDNSQFINNPVYKIFQDSSDILWVATGLSGVYRFDLTTSETTQVFASPYKNDDQWFQYAEHISEDNIGNIVIAANHQVVLIDKSNNTSRIIFELSDLQVENAVNIRVAFKIGDFLLVGTDQGLYARDLSTLKTKLIEYVAVESDVYNNQTDVKQLSLRQNGNLWIGTVKGVYETPLSGLQQHLMNDWELPSTKIINDSLNVWRIVTNVDGSTVIGADKGLFQYQEDEQNLKLILQPRKDKEEITDKSVTALDTDEDGNIWLGTKMSGAMFWSPDSTAFDTTYNQITTSDSKKLSSNVVWSLLEDSESHLWVGTNNGLNKVDLSTQEVTQFFVSEDLGLRFQVSHIENIIDLGNNELLLETGGGLRIFSTLTYQTRPFGDEGSEGRELFEEFSWAVTRENANIIWSLNDAGDLIRFDFEDETASKVMLSDMGYNQSTIFDLLGYDIRTSNLLISASGRLLGLNTTNLEVNVLHSILNESATLNMVPTSWIRDTSNNFWLSYAGRGLFQLNGNSLEQENIFSSSNIMTSDLVYDLALDYQNNIWFSSHSGLHEFNTNSQTLVSYQYMQGVSSSEFNSGAHTTLKDGRLAYGSSKGFVIFSPLEVSLLKRQVDNAPVITQISLYSREIALPYGNLDGTELELEHDDLGLSINFSSLDFSTMENDRFFYRLISNNKVINFPKSVKNKIELSRLPPGEHVLEIFKKTSNQIPANAARIKLKVKYAPWLSPTAIATYALVFGLLLIAFIMRRNATQRILANANQQISLYNNRLTNALKASNSDIWEWSSATKLITSRRMQTDLKYTDAGGNIAFDKHLSLIHELDRLQYLSAWRQFIRGEEEQFDNTYRMLDVNGNYLWFRDAGSISSNIDGVLTVTGTYTNVTENMASKERLKLFGDAFKHTRDWVIILDRNKTPLGANPSFYKAFELNEDESLPKQLKEVQKQLGDDRNTLITRLSGLKPGERWKSEIELKLNTKSICTITDINAIPDENDKRLIEYYLLIMTDITEQKEAQMSLQHLANFDVLTGLINRTMLLERLKRAILFARRHSTSLAVVFIDLDRFKPINDTFGHEAGDTVIIEVAKRIQGVLRSSDVVSRLGGDEFVVVIEEIHSITEVNRLVSKLLQEIERPIRLGSQTVSVSGSAGISMYPDDANDADTLLRNADVAMYSAKETGKNRFQHFTEEMNEKVQQDMLLQNKIKVAVSRDEFENYYQPIIDLKTKKTAGFELLMRWQSNNQFVSPGTFIPIAEQIGLIMEMTFQAIERAVDDIAQWYDSGFRGYVAINLSAKSFTTRPDFEALIQLLKRRNLPNSCLRFEITEGLLIDNDDNTLDYMAEMRDLGFKIALDDFGTGYSSLRYLKDFPIDVLKIDKSFVDDIGIDGATESIIKSTIIMTEMLNMDTVAEGIETRQQVDYFSKTSCRFLQGFYFSKPVGKESCYELFQKDWKKHDQEDSNSSAHKTTAK